MNRSNQRTGGRILLDALSVNGVERAFCVPGESYLAVLDAFLDVPGIDVVVCRQEGGAAMAAEADGKLTGRPGICFVTRGPGACNASAGLHVAFQDSTPMILFVGQVGRPFAEREAFQEVDFRRMFGQMAKWVAEIDDARRIPEFVSRAFHTAINGRPGPVVLALPEDMLGETAEAPAIEPAKPMPAHPGGADMDRVRALLAAAERPLVIAGGGGWDAAARGHLEAFARASRLPVGVSFRCQSYIDNEHPCYAGDVGIGISPKLAERVRAADVLLVVGARLGEATTGGYTLIEAPTPRQALIHVYPGAEELGRVYRPALGINAAPGPFLAAAAALKAFARPRWKDWTSAMRAEFLAWTRPTANPGPVQLAEIVTWLSGRLPADAIVCNGAGNFAAWVHRFFRYRGWRGQLGPTSGSMGYGFPAALAAKRRHPGRPVVCFAGDGCFLMTGQELATAVRYGLAIVTVVVNNGMYGTIRMHQERRYPGRVSATELTNPDFAAYARAFGGHGEVVARTEDFAAAFERAVAFGGPAIIDLRLDPEALTPRASLAEIRAAGLGARAAGA